MTTPKQEVTQLLVNWRNGDKSAFDKLMSLVYAELHRLAHNYMGRERLAHTLQTTALVNEAYVRLIDQHKIDWQNRAHFFAIASQVMRHLLVDYARSRKYAKRGGDARKITLDEKAIVLQERDSHLIALDEALERLAVIDPRKSRIVELRYFGGLSVEETGEVLNISAITVKREWLKAKAWLYRELGPENCDDA